MVSRIRDAVLEYYILCARGAHSLYLAVHLCSCALQGIVSIVKLINLGAVIAPCAFFAIVCTPVTVRSLYIGDPNDLHVLVRSGVALVQ
jgi:hypothetical protein